MLCIFCLQERAPSLEHVFPLAVGGTVTTDRVCSECNSTLGTRVDAALNDFLPIRARRAELGLAGNSGTPPVWYEMFLGDATVIGQDANRVQTTFDKTTGKLDHRQLYHATDVTAPDGRKQRRITIDARDRDQIPKIIQRERKRHGLPPLSDVELAAAAGDFEMKEVKNPVLKLSINADFAYLRHAMMKIAYELAFLWLGEAYLQDPLAEVLRTAVLDPDIASTDKIGAYVGVAENCTAFKQFWSPRKEHHLAYAFLLATGEIAINVRVFDIYAASLVVSHEPSRYVANAADRAKLRFLAIDSVTGRTIDTPFDDESRRLAMAMRTYGRGTALPDPLSDAVAQT
jgi:hypothetical protein